MPIRVTCRCGQNLSVPDTMAGKSGKCPKCSDLIRIPATAAAKTATAAPKTTASDGFDRLLAEAGLDKKKGPTCPGCKGPIEAGAMICVRCGFNLSTGQQMKGVASAGAKSSGPFKNKQLNEARSSLQKETEADEKAKFTGAPWWVYLAIVLGLVTVIGFGVIIVEGRATLDDGTSLRAPVDTFKGKIQRFNFDRVLLLIIWSVSTLVTVMAWIATMVAAFGEKVGQGLLCLFIPIYSHYYAWTRRKALGGTMRILWGWSIVFAVTLTLMLTSGTLLFLLK